MNQAIIAARLQEPQRTSEILWTVPNRSETLPWLHNYFSLKSSRSHDVWRITKHFRDQNRHKNSIKFRCRFQSTFSLNFDRFSAKMEIKALVGLITVLLSFVSGMVSLSIEMESLIKLTWLMSTRICLSSKKSLKLAWKKQTSLTWPASKRFY